MRFISMEVEHFLQIIPALTGMSRPFIQIGMCDTGIIHREVGITDATPFTLEEAKKIQEYLRTVCHVNVEVVK